MSPEALSANAEERFEGIIPTIVTVEIEGKADERFDGIVPAVVITEIGA